MQTYSFLVPAARVRPHQSLALHIMISIVLFAMGIFSGGLYWYTTVSPKFPQSVPALGALGGIGIGAGILVAFIAIRARRRAQPALRIIEAAILFGCAFLLYRETWTAPMLLFLILGTAAGFAYIFERANGGSTANLKVSAAGIQRPFALRHRNIKWYEVKQVLLRRGVLTIDCVDNRLYQYTLNDNQVPGAGFEAFCAAQVAAAEGDRKKNW